MVTLSDLKPCPFCSGSAALKQQSAFDYGMYEYYVFCTECGAQTAKCDNAGAASELWQKRGHEPWIKTP